MKTTFSLKTLSAALLIAAPWAAHASLDALTVQSKLGEPFSATVALSGEEAQTALNNPDSVSVSGASHLRVRVVQRNHTPVLVISSAAAVRDPITSFTVHVGTASRQYSALIDPPTAPGVTRKPTQTTPAQIIAASEAEGRVASGDIRLGHNYVTRADDTVIAIARRIKTPDVSLGQAMRAIIAKNPHAFRNGNPNILMSGVTIRIPTEAELARPPVARVTKKPARAAVKAKAPVTAPDAAETTTSPEKPIIERPPAASEPVTTASEPVTAASETVITAASDAAVTASETAAASDAASEAAHATTTPPVAQETPPAETDGIDWMAWLPYLGGGLLLLLLLALLISRRGKTRTGEEPFVLTSDEFDSAPATHATAADAEAFDDGITFDTLTPAATVKTQPVAMPHGDDRLPVLTEDAAGDDFVLDLPDLDLSKEDKSTFMEAESFIDDFPAGGDAAAVAEGTDIYHDTPPPRTPAIADDHAFDFDLQADADTTQFMESLAKPRRAPSVEDQLADGAKQKLTFDPDFGLDLSLEDEAVVPPMQQHTATDFAFDYSQVKEAVQPEVTPPAPEPVYDIETATFAVDDTDETTIEFELPEPGPQIAQTVAASAPVSEETIEFELPEPEPQIAQTVAASAPVSEETIEFELPEPEPQIAQTVAASAPAGEETIEFELPEPEPQVAQTVATSAPAGEETIKFELPEPQTVPTTVSAPALAHTPPPLPVVEAAAITPAPLPVSDDAPLQAKLELAKMYLSMDDNEGAIETLCDLMDSCAEGDAIYREAEALLATLPQA